jgi:DNA polymerase I-like protein with 3'-5' exonuclease and polymerase domains
LFLAECEWNGLLYDEELCHQREEQLQEELTRLTSILHGVYPDVPINFNSGDQLSAFLYGGTISEEIREPNGYYKSGLRTGQCRYKLVLRDHQLPRLCNPLPRSELKKEGVWATDEGTLRKLKGPAAKKYVNVLLEHSRIGKLIDTYYRKLPVMNKEFNWPVNKIHGQFNQCVAATGRLSSSKPNLQNFAGECQDILISEYND